MKKIILVSVFFVALILAWYWYSSRAMHDLSGRTEGVDTGQDQTASLNPVLLPLYTGVSWKTPHRTNDGSVEVSSVLEEGLMDIAAVSMPFMRYYETKLEEDGWTRDISREAGGPGSELAVFIKDGAYVSISFRSDFTVRHEDAPSECPCTVSFMLRSGTDNRE